MKMTVFVILHNTCPANFGLIFNHVSVGQLGLKRFQFIQMIFYSKYFGKYKR